uniref:Uncharacterized protein n=1 Tax=Pseudo-nitzschia australis TaxID=44445 RepID=A0A7S4ELH4_9STRA
MPHVPNRRNNTTSTSTRSRWTTTRWCWVVLVLCVSFLVSRNLLRIRNSFEFEMFRDETIAARKINTTTTTTTTTATATATATSIGFNENESGAIVGDVVSWKYGYLTQTSSSLSSIVTIDDKKQTAKAIQATKTKTPSIATEIPTNTQSAYASSDVLRILHVPSKFQIEIHLQANTTRRCQDPVFVGRISGWSLAMIEFETRERRGGGYGYGNSNGNDATDIVVVVGKYDPHQMPVTGKYYIEIIVLMCEAPPWENGSGADDIDDNGDDDDTGVDLKKFCIEDTTNATNRITAGNGDAFIEIDSSPMTSGVGSASMRTTNMMIPSTNPFVGRWLHKSLLEKERGKKERSHNGGITDNTLLPLLETSSSDTTKPLFTRYQPRGCMLSDRIAEHNKNSTTCNQAVDRSRFDPYVFHWAEDGPVSKPNEPYLHLVPRDDLPDRTVVPQDDNDTTDTIDNNNDHRQRQPQHVCFVGSSHSVLLSGECNALLQRTRIIQAQKRLCFEASSHRALSNKCKSLLQRTRKKQAQTQNQYPLHPLLLDLKCSYINVQFPFQIQKGCPLQMDPKECKLNFPPLSPLASKNSTAVSALASSTWVAKNIEKPNCTHVVLGLFQWPFSFYQTHPKLTFPKWKQDIVKVVRILLHYNDRASPNTNSNNNNKTKKKRNNLKKIILRSVHTNGLKEHVSKCPPNDFRNPYNAHVCNRMLRDIATSFESDTSSSIYSSKNGNSNSTHTKEFSNTSGVDTIVSFVDTDFITGPVWDSAEDWSHYNGEIGTQEIKYLLYEIFKNDYKFQSQ